MVLARRTGGLASTVFVITVSRLAIFDPHIFRSGLPPSTTAFEFQLLAWVYNHGIGLAVLSVA
jgi:hypothetical protein